jgi:hypothetical protein
MCDTPPFLVGLLLGEALVEGLAALGLAGGSTN